MKVYITIGPDGGITVWPYADDAIRYATEEADRGNPTGVRKVEACSYDVDPGNAFLFAYSEQCKPTTVVFSEPFATDSPRARQEKARQLVNKALGSKS